MALNYPSQCYLDRNSESDQVESQILSKERVGHCSESLVELPVDFVATGFDLLAADS